MPRQHVVQLHAGRVKDLGDADLVALAVGREVLDRLYPAQGARVLAHESPVHMSGGKIWKVIALVYSLYNVII